MSYATPVAATPPEIYAEDLPGEIADYVNSADGATVEFQKNDVQMVFINFTILLYYLILGKRYIGQKTEHKGLQQQVKDLQQELQQFQKDQKDSEEILKRWEVVTTLIEGTFIIAILVYYTN